MALQRTQLISVVSLILSLAQWVVATGDSGKVLLLPNEGSRPAMILPLHHSVPDDSSVSDFSPRRQLQRSQSQRHPDARMRLYDDLLRNGYYTTRLWIGTPPQRFALIVDTGSTVTYVPCSTCQHCGKHQDPKFQPEDSETYQPVKCTWQCNCDTDRKQCTYERRYAEMSTSSGVLGEDVISFGNQSELSPQRATFGCENDETGDLYTQHADGIMGLGRGDLSIMDQLVEKKVISDAFSLCYGGMGVGGGAMVLGGISPPADMVFTHSDPGRSPYYNINLKEVHVAGKRLNLNPKVFDGKHGAVLDSGTTYAYLPESAFLAFKDAIMKDTHSLKRISGPDPRYNDICFSGAGSDVSQLSKSFPVVDMVFENGHKLSLSPENYLFRHLKVRGAYCLGVFSNGNDPTTLLGGIVVRNTLVMYDREHTKIGFWKTNCSELWKRLHVSDAPPHYSVGLGVQQLVDAVPEILNISNIVGYQVSNVGSPSINETILLELARGINSELAKDEVSGAVVTHGTDSMEETAFFLQSVVNSTKPVVVVGAMRPATALSADGPLNLLQAVTLASSDNAKDRGVMITLNDRIGSAYYTTKNNANSLDTFYSTEAGQLGFFINQVPYFYFEPAKPIGATYFDLKNITDLAQVDILYAHQDMAPELFNASVEAGAEGLVTAGMGAGGLSSKASMAAEAVYNATGIPIVASHRSADGFVPSSDDSYAIASGFYNPQKARILLQLALTMGYGYDEIKELFALSYPAP